MSARTEVAVNLEAVKRVIEDIVRNYSTKEIIEERILSLYQYPGFEHIDFKSVYAEEMGSNVKLFTITLEDSKLRREEVIYVYRVGL